MLALRKRELLSSLACLPVVLGSLICTYEPDDDAFLHATVLLKIAKVTHFGRIVVAGFNYNSHRDGNWWCCHSTTKLMLRCCFDQSRCLWIELCARHRRLLLSRLRRGNSLCIKNVGKNVSVRNKLALACPALYHFDGCEVTRDALF